MYQFAGPNLKKKRSRGAAPEIETARCATDRAGALGIRLPRPRSQGELCHAVRESGAVDSESTSAPAPAAPFDPAAIQAVAGRRSGNARRALPAVEHRPGA